MMVVVVYDVNTETSSGRRRLRNVAKTCMRYGQRVQNSVFECVVTPADYAVLKDCLERIADLGLDSLRFYNLGAKYSNRIEAVGVERHLPDDGIMML